MLNIVCYAPEQIAKSDESRVYILKRYCMKTLGATFSLASLTLPLSLQAQGDVLASITSGMQRYSEVATKIKENESYQPYIVSVFQGKELEKLGIVNLEEALMLVPGVDMATDNFNNRTPIFRGSNPLAFGQSKLFIDGVPANNVFFDAYSEHLRMPVEMIKRIEVVRGPGSKTDGFNAYAGSINVITYAEEIEGFESADKVVLKGGSHRYRMGGFVKTYNEGDFRLTTDLYFQRDDKKLYAGPDGLSQGVLSLNIPQDALGPGVPASDVIVDNTDISKTGNAYLWTKNYSLGMTLSYKDVYAKFRILDHAQASAYGINYTLAAHSDDRVKQPNDYFEVGLDKVLGDFELSVKGGLKYDTFDSNAHLVYDGFEFIDYLNLYTNPGAFDWDTRIDFPDGTYGQHLAKQRTLYQSTFLRYGSFENHDISFGYRVMKEETVKMYSKISNWLTGDITPVDYTELFPFTDANAKRYTRIFSFQDTYHVSKQLSFLFGFNYERNTFDDPGFEPRVSMVYQHDAKNIYKLIYSEAHRNPSWQEFFTQYNASRWGNLDLKPERVTAYEAAYVHKIDATSFLQANLFYLENRDEINNKALNEVYQNSQDSEIHGVELEYKGSLLRRDSIYLNYSYVRGKDNKDLALANVATHMLKGYYSYDLTDAFSASTVVKYIGDKKRLEEDTRDSLNSYTKVDATLRYDNPKHNYHAMLSVKNVFDADIRFPSIPNSYIEDYRQEGRTFMLTFGKEF